ncbi:MAG: hypothetical protein H3Z54_12625 [archaeon]|nr:hypothetical protein [archaeon]
MKCYIHRDVDAIGVCSVCGQGICGECSVRIGGKLYCKPDADRIFAPKEEGGLVIPSLWRKILSVISLILLIFSLFMSWSSFGQPQNGIVFGPTLLDYYTLIGKFVVSEVPKNVVILVIVTLVLYPIAIVSGLISLGTKGKVSKIAILLGGIIGLVSAVTWFISFELYKSLLPALTASFLRLGIGPFIAIIGSIILLVIYFIKERT